MFGRVTIRLGIGPHSSSWTNGYIWKTAQNAGTGTLMRRRLRQGCGLGLDVSVSRRSRDVDNFRREETETLTIFVEKRPRRDVGTSRDRLETETSRPRPQPWRSFILIRLTVWSQCTNVTDKQTDRTEQRSDSIGRTVLQTVAQKWKKTILRNRNRWQVTCSPRPPTLSQRPVDLHV